MKYIRPIVLSCYTVAVEIFKRNIELYTNDGNLWDSLGDGYMSINLKDEAVKSYQKIFFEPQPG